MGRNLRRRLLLTFVGLTAAAQDDAPWRSKQIAAWSEDDARQVLTESPWVKTFTPTVGPAQDNGRRSGGMGRGGIGVGGVGVAMPGMGGRRGMGGGYPGSGAQQDGGSSRSQAGGGSSSDPPRLTLRWESAMPVRAAELKAHDDTAPNFDNSHFAIAVYGIPGRMLPGDIDKLAEQLKKDAAIKRDGKKDFKPSSVLVVDRLDTRVVLYLFPMTNEITRQDHRLEFEAKVGRMELNQSFFVGEMVWQGKLEL